MKKHLLSLHQLRFYLLIPGLLLTSSIAYTQNSLVVNDPSFVDSVADFPAIIEEATLRMEPQGIYANAILEMSLATRMVDEWLATDTLELVLHFNLPQDAIVYDAFLWIDGEQVQAGIYERNLGTEIYESITQRSEDPLLLLKMNQGKYQLRIFPFPALESRRLRIDFLVPAQWRDGVAQANLPIALLTTSDIEVPLELEIYENDAFPLLDFSDPDMVFIEANGIQSLSTNSNQVSVAEYISWELPAENGVWLEIDEQNNEYQYLFDTRGQIPEFNSGKDIVLIMHTEEAEIPESAIKKLLNQAFALYLNDQTRVAILKDEAVLNPEQPWFTSLESLEIALNNENYSTAYDLTSKLREANVFLNDHAEQAGLVMLVSSDTLTNAQNADITIWLSDLINRYPTLVWDLRNWGMHSDFNFGRTITAYTPLLQRTGGFISSKGSVEDRLFSGLENRHIKSGFISLEIEPVIGLTYSNYGNLSTSGSEGISPQYRQFGKFVGDPNWQVDYSTLINNQFLNHTFSVEFTTNSVYDPHLMYIGNKLIFNEQNNVSPLTIANESKAERILTTKTVFLVIDPVLLAEDDCVGCATMAGMTVPTRNLSPLKWEAQLNSNPAKEKLSLRWKVAPEVQQLDLQVINLSGQICYQQTIKGLFSDETTFFEWDGVKNLPTGTYLISLTINNEVQRLRLIKS
jgi:hypothetical protein